MIDRCLDYMHQLEEQLEREKRIAQWCGLRWFYIERILNMPQIVYEPFLNFAIESKPYVEDLEDMIVEISTWEYIAQMKLNEYLSLQQLQEYNRRNEVPDELLIMVQNMVNDFQEKTRIPIPYYAPCVEQQQAILNELRLKYIIFLIEKYDKRRNRQTP